MREKSKYSKEFKQDALRMCEREGVRQTSEKLGVAQKALYLWQRQARLEGGEAPTGLRSGESIEQGFILICNNCIDLIAD